jgi:hypothetical protein
MGFFLQLDSWLPRMPKLPLHVSILYKSITRNWPMQCLCIISYCDYLEPYRHPDEKKCFVAKFEVHKSLNWVSVQQNDTEEPILNM